MLSPFVSVTVDCDYLASVFLNSQKWMKQYARLLPYSCRHLKYTRGDEKAILYALLHKDCYKKCGGNTVWKGFERLKVQSSAQLSQYMYIYTRHHKTKSLKTPQSSAEQIHKNDSLST